MSETLKHFFFMGWSGNKIDKKGTEYREIHLDFYDGEGLSTTQYSSLVRPFWKILKDGKPVNNVTFVEHYDDAKYRLLGSFTYTNKRLVFFPGIFLALANPTPEYLEKGKLDFYADHMSLDDNLDTWHYTDLSKKTSNNKLNEHRTKPISEHLKLWFIWALKPNSLELLPRRQVLLIKGTKSEIERRSEIITSVLESKRLVTTELQDSIEGSHYCNFEFFVHAKNVEKEPILETLPLTPVYYEYTPLIVKEDRKITQAKIFPVQVPGFSGTVFIRYSKIKGSLPTTSLLGPGDHLPDF